jgi:hypothetical protein
MNAVAEANSSPTTSFENNGNAIEEGVIGD